MNIVLKKKINNIDRINDILILLLMISIYLFSTNPIYNIYYKIMAVIFILYNIMVIILKKRADIINWQWIRWLIFSVIAFFSLNWSIIPKNDIVIVLFFTTAIVFSLTNYIKSRREFEKVIAAIINSGIFLCIYIYIKVGLKALISGRLVLDGYNSNDIGMKLSISAIGCVYFIIMKKRNKLNWLAFSILVPFIIFTNSRKALLAFVFGIIIYIILTAKNSWQMLKYTIISFICVLMVYYVVFNINWFYNAIGIRFEKLINQLITGSGGSNSDKLRISFIEMGLYLAKSKPFLGYGIGNFNNISFGFTGVDTYSHNNYIELLVGVGVIGCMAYYSSYYYTIKKLIKMYKVNRKFISFSLTLVIIIIFMEFALVSFNEIFYATVITLCYCATKIKNKG